MMKISFAVTEKGRSRKMIEAILAWVCLFVGIVELDALWFIASGAFAIASQICMLRERKEQK
jgi:hypothetical protein